MAGPSGAYNDADADPITHECQFFNTATAPTSWTACTSPATYGDLAETTTTPYTFRVRAVDSGDTSRYYVVRDRQSPPVSGQILIESLSAGKPVRIDALVFPPF